MLVWYACDIKNKYIISSVVTVSIVVLILWLPLFCSQTHQIVLIKYFLIYIVFTYIQFNKYTHLLIQTNKISHRGADSEIVLRAQKPLLAGEPNCVVYIYLISHHHSFSSSGVVISKNATTYYYSLNWSRCQTVWRHSSMDLL